MQEKKVVIGVIGGGRKSITKLIESLNNPNEPPYSEKDYEDAKQQGLDLDDWNDYVKYYGLGEEPDYD